VSESGGVVTVGMRKQDGSWSDNADTIQPIRPAINHDAAVALFDKQGAVAPVPARADFDFPAGAEER
jgi:hypothetical protein